MEISKRENKRAICNDWLIYLYDEIILYCENDYVSYSGYNLNKNPFLDKLQEKLNFSLISKMNNVQKNQINTFYYTCSSGKIEGWFRHMRNAIAHNRIFLSSNNSRIIIEDVNKGKLTMYAEIYSFDKLREIINGIKDNYKQAK